MHVSCILEIVVWVDHDTLISLSRMCRLVRQALRASPTIVLKALRKYQHKKVASTIYRDLESAQQVILDLVSLCGLENVVGAWPQVGPALLDDELDIFQLLCAKNGRFEGLQLAVWSQSARSYRGKLLDNCVLRACTRGDLTMLSYLAAEGADCRRNFDFPLRLAAEYGYLNVVCFLIQRMGANPAAVGDEPITVAARNGHASIVEFLCQQSSVNPHANDDIALRYAVQRNHVNTVRVLLQCQPPTLQVERMLFWAREKRFYQMYHLLREFLYHKTLLYSPATPCNSPSTQL